MERSRSPPPALRRGSRRQNSAILPLPTRQDVSDFREKRLLIHLHEQLCEQLEEDQTDWQLHFQLANLMAFTDYFSSLDSEECEGHYQEALKLLRKLHTDDYADFEQRRQTSLELDTIASSEAMSPGSPISISSPSTPDDPGSPVHHLDTPTRDSDSEHKEEEKEEEKEPVLHKVTTPTITVTDHQNNTSIINSNSNHNLANFVMFDKYFGPKTEEAISPKRPVLHDVDSSKSEPDLSSNHSSNSLHRRSSRKTTHRVQHSADHDTESAMKKKWENDKRKEKRKKKKSRKRRQNAISPPNGVGVGMDSVKEVVFVHRNRRKHRRKKPNKALRPSPVLKTRSLKIVVINHQQQVSDEILCEYTSPLSEEEIQREKQRDRGWIKHHLHSNNGKGGNGSSLFLEDPASREHYKRKSCDVDVSSIAAKYLTSVSQSNAAMYSYHRKRPSIIAMLTGDDDARSLSRSNSLNTNPPEPSNLSRSPSNSLNRRRTGSSITNLKRTKSGHSPHGAVDIDIEEEEEEMLSPIEDEDYLVPLDIIIGYTQCYFGYGKWLTETKRIGEGIEHLLDCVAWYHDNFTDPSCLTSLILPPQFLFEESVKSRNQINFRTLTKFVSKILSDEQRRLDKQYREMEMSRYIREYEEYWVQYQTQLRAEMEHTALPGLHSNATSRDLGQILGIANSNSDGNAHKDGPGASSMTPLVQSESNESDEEKACAAIEPGISNVSSAGMASVRGLKLDVIHSDGVGGSAMHFDSMITPPSVNVLSPDSIASPAIDLSPKSPFSPYTSSHQIDYKVYPKDIQDLASEFIQFCP